MKKVRISVRSKASWKNKIDVQYTLLRKFESSIYLKVL